MCDLEKKAQCAATGGLTGKGRTYVEGEETPKTGGNKGGVGDVLDKLISLASVWRKGLMVSYLERIGGEMR